MNPSPLNLDRINRMDRAEFAQTFGHIFEHSPWVAELAWEARPFDSAEAIHRAMIAAVESRDRAQRIALLAAHPDLAGREAQTGTMTQDSTREQARAGLDALSTAELARIGELNTAYRARHGFPFIACVRHYTKDGILFEFERRLTNDTEAEFRTAHEQIYAITGWRLRALFAAAQRDLAA